MESHSFPKILLFLGSGSSFLAGYRTFETFPDLIFNSELRQKENLPPLHNTTIGILREIEQQLKIERTATTHDNFLWKLNDYKRLWQMLSVDGVLQSRFLTNTKLWGDFSYFAQITEDAINDISATTVHHYSLNRVEKAKSQDLSIYESLKRIYLLYEKIAYLNNPDKPFLPIFTTNYDMLIEDLYFEFCKQSSNLPLINGITNCCQEGAIWNVQEYQKNDTQNNGFHIYRVHGCVCWFFWGYGDENIYFHRRDCLQQDFRNLCAMYPGKLSLTGVNPHGYGFRKFYHMLQNCNCIIFIGFSFRDYDVKVLMLNANAQREKPINIIAIDPALHSMDINLILEATAKQTQFSIRIPKTEEIKAIESRFGTSDVNEELLEVLQNFS